MKIEIWKDVVGYEGLYKVSNLGRVKSLWFKSVRRERMLTPCTNDNGYQYVGLTKDKKLHNHYIHRLVAEAFIDNPEGKEVVNHKDYVRNNNNVENLEWCTRSENNYYSSERMKIQHKVTVPNKSGYRYIGIDKKGRYRVVVRDFECRVRNLEQALEIRNRLLEHYNYELS